MSNPNPHAAAIADAQDERFAPPSTILAEIDEIKHGINSKTGQPYTVFAFKALDVLDQKLPRPDVIDDQKAVEAGELLTLYRDFKYESGRTTIKNAMAAVVGAKLGRDVSPMALKLDPAESSDPEACQVYVDSFDVLDKKGEVKTHNRDFFQGVQVVIDVEPTKDKQGNPKRFTDFTFARAS